MAGTVAGANTVASAQGDGIFQLLFGQLTEISDEVGAGLLQVSDQKLMQIEPIDNQNGDAALLALLPDGEKTTPQSEGSVSPTVTLINPTSPLAAQTELTMDSLSETQTIEVDLTTHALGNPGSAQTAAVSQKRLAELRERLEGGRVAVRPSGDNGAADGIALGSSANGAAGLDGGWLNGGLSALASEPSATDLSASQAQLANTVTTARALLGQADGHVMSAVRLNAARLTIAETSASPMVDSGELAAEVPLADEATAEALTGTHGSDVTQASRLAATMGRQLSVGTNLAGQEIDDSAQVVAEDAAESDHDVLAEMTEQASQQNSDNNQGKNAATAQQSIAANLANSTRSGASQWQNHFVDVSASRASSTATLRTSDGSIDPTLLNTDGTSLTGNARLDPTPLPASTLSLREANWDKGLGANVAFMLREDIKTASIRVNPEELGALDIQLESEGENLKVSITAAHAVTRDVLEAALPRLREQFGSLGFERVDVDVREQAQDNGQGESLFAGGEQEKPGSDARSNSQSAYATEGGEATIKAIRADALLDTYA